jgi:DNA-binding protein HU-beta
LVVALDRNTGVFGCVCYSVPQSQSAADGKVTLVGFGTFSKVRRKAREDRNPQTGEVIEIKASNAVKFNAGKKLKEAV